MILLAIVALCLFIIAIASCIEKMCDYGGSDKAENFGWIAGFICSILLAIGSYYVYYDMSRIDVEELYTKQNNILLNYKTLTLQMNRIAIVKTQYDKLLIDVANLNQSSNVSSAFNKWVESANNYNLELAQQKAKREIGFIGKLWYGWRVPLKPELKYIEIKI